MKRLTLFFTVLSAFSLFITMKASAEEIPASRLPEEVTEFIGKHFENATVMKAEKERNKYEVELSSGFKLDFYNNGSWKKIEAKNEPIPSSIMDLLPEDIRTSLKTAHQGKTVTEISKSIYGYELELLDPARDEEQELRFNNSGRLIDVDM